jgi:hypothetical protein
VVLVRTEAPPAAGSLAIEHDGLAEALLHERLSVLGLLQPSVEPLLSLLPAGRMTASTRDLLGPDQLRTVLAPLVEAGHLVVIQAPGIDTVEGEAMVGAADLGVVVVDLGRSRSRQLASIAARGWRQRTGLAAVVIANRGRPRRAPASSFGSHWPGGSPDGPDVHDATREQSASVTR